MAKFFMSFWAFVFFIFCSTYGYSAEVDTTNKSLENISVSNTNIADNEKITVNDIRLDGLQRIEPGTVFSNISINVKDKISKKQIAKAIRDLFSTGFFENVEVKLEKNILVISVQERPSIGAIEISGTKEFDKETLLEALKSIGLGEARIFDKSLLDRAEQELKSQYLSRAKYDVKVQSTTSPLSRNRVAISISIDEGEDARIKEIKILGSKVFNEKDLLDLFSLTTPNWITWYTKSDQYSREKLNGDIEELRSFYLDQGYLDFSIDSTLVSLSPDRTEVFITILVDEGEKFTIGEVNLSGELLGQEKYLKENILFQSSEVFSNKKLQLSVDKISQRMGDLGYAFARVTPIPKKRSNSLVVDFDIKVDPGSRVYVRRINISGNAKTRDEVIRRELRQLESSWYDADRIRLSRNRIDRLGYFQSVEMSTKVLKETNDQVDIDVSVEERPLGSITAGIGLSSSEDIVFNAGVSQQNFLGTGTDLSFQLNTSDISQTYAFSYTDPYWTDDGVSRSFDIYTRKFDASKINSLGDYTSDSKGFGVRFGIPYTEFDRIYFGFKYEATEIGLGSNPPGRFSTYCIPYMPDCSTDSYIASVGWSRDSRDNGLAPSRGTYQKANIDYATPLGGVEYARVTYKLQWYKPLTKKITYATNLNTGYGVGIGGTEFPIFRNFYAGGIGSLRGFANRSIGEQDETDGSSIGGTKKIVLNNEILMPLPGMAKDRTIRVFGYLDIGSIWGSDQKLSFDEVRASIGIGFSWFSPVGPLKVSFGSPIRKKDTDNLQKVQFQLGTAF
jgi:outer membrane protein insertion porin family